MKTVLVTGATGFLGKSLANRFKDNLDIKLSMLSQHGDSTLPAGRQDSGVQSIDLLNLAQTKEYISKIKPDVIFHTAAYVNLTRDYETAKKCFDSNLLAMLNLLEAVKESPPKKFIFISTEEIYGNNKIPFTEGLCPQPPSMYSISKVAGEQLCKLYGEQIGFQTIVARLATFYGPGDQLHRLIPTIIRNALANQPILLNSGAKKRDYIYIDDAIDALTKMIHVNLSTFEIINVGGGKSNALLEIVHEIVSQTKSSSNIVCNAFPDRIGEANEWLMDLSKAKELLTWAPKTSINHGIANTIANFAVKQ